MSGQIANVAPLVTAASASDGGNRHTPTAIPRPTINPASDACHDGRRNTPRVTSTVTIGRAATATDRASEPPTGVSSWGNGCAAWLASDKRPAPVDAKDIPRGVRVRHEVQEGGREIGGFADAPNGKPSHLAFVEGLSGLVGPGIPARCTSNAGRYGVDAD